MEGGGGGVGGEGKEKEEEKKVSWKEKLQIYEIPYVKMCFHTFVYLFFLVCVFVSCVVPGGSVITWLDVLVMFWIFGKTLEEALQFYEEQDLYFQDFWNQVRFFFFFFFFGADVGYVGLISFFLQK